MPPVTDTDTLVEQIVDLVGRQPEGTSAATIAARLGVGLSRRTIGRYLTRLVAEGRLHRAGRGPLTVYLPVEITRSQSRSLSQGKSTGLPDEDASLFPLAGAARSIRDYVRQPLERRRPIGYSRRLLAHYEPNQTHYLPPQVRSHLRDLGRPREGNQPAGTFVRDILSRLLIDLSWASSRLEGNTYSRLDTQRLIEFGQAAEGKDARETQMILNHKAAIELLVDSADELGFNRYSFLNLHALLSDNLLPDPMSVGRLRRRPVEISGSVYVPTAVPQLIEESMTLLLDKANAIVDPFEQAFFVLVHIPYLQPFEDVNKRVSRLGANIAFIKTNLCPLSFVDVPREAYVEALLGVYELGRWELLADLFAWAYERSCSRYVVLRDSLVEPDPFRMRHRDALGEVVSQLIRLCVKPTAAAIRDTAAQLVEKRDLERFVRMAEREFEGLYEGNIARYRLSLVEYRRWKEQVGA